MRQGRSAEGRAPLEPDDCPAELEDDRLPSFFQVLAFPEPTATYIEETPFSSGPAQ